MPKQEIIAGSLQNPLEYGALVHWHRPVIRLHLVRDFPAALNRMLHVFGQALQRFRVGI
jgi:hypothetical protein